MGIPDEITQVYSLEGNVVVVTGAGSGIGREIARMLGLCGAAVAICDIDPNGLAETRAMLANQGTEAREYQLDVSAKEQVDAMADDVLRECGRLDVWVNCAAISPLHSILDTDPAEAQRVVAVNLFGAYWGCMAAGRIMGGRGGGVIINISSAGGAKPLPNLAAYGMSKAAMNSLTWTAATEFGPLGIRVNAVAPGWIETPATALMYRESDGSVDPVRREKVLAEIASSSPLGRIGHVSDVARAVVYLASDAGSFVTGQVFRVNGGESM